MPVKVTLEGDMIRVDFPYDKGLVEICRDIPGRIYDWDVKANFFPLSSLNQVIESFSGAELDSVVSNLYHGSVDDMFYLSEDAETDLCDKLPFVDELRPYQKADIEFLFDKKSALNANEMGLGKTVEAIALVLLDKAERVLIVCPNTVKYNWGVEIEKWVPDMDYAIVSGDKATRKEIIESDVNFLVINYESARIHAEDLNNRVWDIAIIDEAHRIKNRKAKQTTAVHGIKAKRKILMTGTPIMNRPDELWSLLNYIHPNEYRSYWKFANRYCRFGGFEDRQIIGYQNLNDLHTNLKPIMVRRRKDQVLKDLPEQIHQTINIDLDSIQRELYNEVEEQIYIELSKEKELTIPNALARLTRLRQVAVHPLLIDAEDYPSAKFKELKNLLGEIIYDGHKIVVFSEFKKATRLLKEILEADYQIAYVDGSIKPQQRMEEINKFQNDDKCNVFLATAGTCREGVNLTASSYVVFLDKNWVPANNEQAAARLHRIGQKNTVNVISLLCKDTIEEGIENLLTKKQNLFNLIVESDGGKAVQQITFDDIKMLLRRD